MRICGFRAFTSSCPDPGSLDRASRTSGPAVSPVSRTAPTQPSRHLLIESLRRSGGTADRRGWDDCWRLCRDFPPQKACQSDGHEGRTALGLTRLTGPARVCVAPVTRGKREPLTQGPGPSLAPISFRYWFHPVGGCRPHRTLANRGHSLGPVACCGPASVAGRRSLHHLACCCHRSQRRSMVRSARRVDDAWMRWREPLVRRHILSQLCLCGSDEIGWGIFTAHDTEIHSNSERVVRQDEWILGITSTAVQLLEKKIRGDCDARRTGRIRTLPAPPGGRTIHPSQCDADTVFKEYPAVGGNPGPRVGGTPGTFAPAPRVAYHPADRSRRRSPAAS